MFWRQSISHKTSYRRITNLEVTRFLKFRSSKSSERIPDYQRSAGYDNDSEVWPEETGSVCSVWISDKPAKYIQGTDAQGTRIIMVKAVTSKWWARWIYISIRRSRAKIRRTRWPYMGISRSLVFVTGRPKRIYMVKYGYLPSETFTLMMMTDNDMMTDCQHCVSTKLD